MPAASGLGGKEETKGSGTSSRVSSSSGGVLTATGAAGLAPRAAAYSPAVFSTVVWAKMTIWFNIKKLKKIKPPDKNIFILFLITLNKWPEQIN